ncbi:PREDICTED: protein FAM208B, partial [Pterocles gutturalis]
MPVLALESLPERNHKALYCPWRGQLSIRGQLLCNIALRTPYSSTIPAQLPPNLDIKHVMGLSDLKKKLPEAAFGKKNYIENEVCFQGVYFSLYEVEISNKDQNKMDQLVENLKEKDLAIIKYLQDQGVLILLTSFALARDDGFDPKEPVSLLALFLFTSSRSVCLRGREVPFAGFKHCVLGVGSSPEAPHRHVPLEELISLLRTTYSFSTKAGKHNPKDEREDSDTSLKIASVLPGLRYALQKATSSSRGDTVNASVRIKQHFQEYTKLHENTQPTSGQNSEVPLSSLLSPTKDECANPFKKHSEQSFSQLQHYLSDPSSYTLEMSAALGCLTGAAQSLCCDSEASRKVDFSSALPPDPIPPKTATEIKIKSKNPKPTVGLDKSGEGSPKDVNSDSKLWVQQSRRRSSRAIVVNARKKWSPLKMQMHPVEDSGRNRKATEKKKINITLPLPKKPGLTASSNEPMLKLANLQFPHRRKRGAEVLSAEFVHKTQSEPVQEETSAPDDPGLETKRPKTLKKPAVKKVAETVTKPVKNKMLKSVANSPSKPQAKKQAESERKETFSVLLSEVSSQHHGADSQTSESSPGGVADLGFDLKANDYESHALNLLADLALGSCIPSCIPRDSGTIPVSCSPSGDSKKEQQSHPKQKSLRVASDHEYHRVDKFAKGAASPSKASPNHKLPPDEKIDLNDSENKPGIFSKNSMSPSPAKPHALPPRETQEAADVNKHSFISIEHSYASLMPEHSKKHITLQKWEFFLGPLVGKVLPFRHQQNSTHHQRPFEAMSTRRRSSQLPPRLKENFAKSHTVNICSESLKVTCHWEGEYLFNLDSRYTNDALEKTVIRALHGPWDPDLPDDVEEMKLILHMWVALFYSKPNKLLSNTRKVVEHSNPEKYVSISSIGDFLELSDDSEDGFELETCPEDSRSDPDHDQTPSSSLDRSTHCEGSFHPEESSADSRTDADEAPGVVNSTVSSSSGELPCGEEEPSSTSCPESLSLAEHADKSLAVKERQPDVIPEERVRDISTTPAEELPKEGLTDAAIAPSPSHELSDAGKPPAALSREDLSSQAPNSSAAPWSDAPSVLRGRGEQQERAAGSVGGPSAPEERENVGDAGNCPEVEDGSWAMSDGLRRACDSMPLEASPKSAKPDGASGKGRESQDSFGNPEKEEEEPNSTPGSLGSAGETLGDGLEQKDEDRAPSAEMWAPAGSKAGGTALTSSPGSSSVCLVSLDGGTDPGAAAEEQEATASIRSPSQSELGGSSCLSQRCGGDIYGDLTSPSAGESNQEEKKVLVEEERSSPPANRTDVLDESLGAGDGFTFDSPASAGDSEAGESDNACLSVDKSPEGDETNATMVADVPEEPETSRRDLLESEPSSLVTEGMSAMKEHSKQQQSSPKSFSLPACAGSAPASPQKQDPLPHDRDAEPHHHLLEQSKRQTAPCQPGKPCEQGGAAEVSVAAESPENSLEPRCAEEVKKDADLCRAEPAESSPADVLVPGDRGSTPPSPLHDHKAGLRGAEPDSGVSVHPEMLSPGTSPSPDGAPWSCCPRCASPGDQAADVAGSQEKQPILPEDLEGGSSVPSTSPASFSAGELLEPRCEPQTVCNHGEHEAEGSDAFADLHRASVEVEEGEIPALCSPMLPLHVCRRISGESLELSDAEDTSGGLPRAKQLPSKDRHTGLSFEGLFETFSSDSDQEYFGGTSRSWLTAKDSYSMRSVDAAGTRTSCDSSSGSSGHTEGCSEDWGSLGAERGCSWAERSWPIGLGETSSRHVPPYVNIRNSQGVIKDYQNFLVTKKFQERMGKSPPSKRRGRWVGQSHLLRSMIGTWKGLEEITQHTLDMERLRFHYKLKQILKSGKPPFSTSKSIFPKDFSPQVMSETLPVQEAPIPLSPRSRSPLQVTILPSDTWSSGLGCHSCRGDPCTPWQDTRYNERSRARSRTANQGHAAPFHLSKLKYENKLKDTRGDIAVILDEYAEFNRAMKTPAFEEMIADLCSTLRFHLRSVAKEACGRSDMFYLLETGEDPFFARVKTLLRKDGHVEIEPSSFCKAKHPDTDRLLVVIRNEDISSHIHNVPCLLKLKHCPNVVFAGVDSPEDLTRHTYQELFQTGGFVVLDAEVLETVTLGQLKEVVKVLEKLNRSGRWKWLLHYNESKKLREGG